MEKHCDLSEIADAFQQNDQYWWYHLQGLFRANATLQWSTLTAPSLHLGFNQQTLLSRAPEYNRHLTLATCDISPHSAHACRNIVASGMESDGVEDQYRLAEQYIPDPTVGSTIPFVMAASLISACPGPQCERSLAYLHSCCRICQFKQQLRCQNTILLHLNNARFIDAERLRFESLKHLLMGIPLVAQSGDPDALGLLECFFDLFNDVKGWIHLPDRDDKLLRAFNDADTAGHILYPMRTLEQYCGEEIDTLDREIDEIGTSALYDVMLRPAGIGLEVYNLHTNPGEDVDLARKHDPSPTRLGGEYTPLNPPVIRLLFRPIEPDMSLASFGPPLFGNLFPNNSKTGTNARQTSTFIDLFGSNHNTDRLSSHIPCATHMSGLTKVEPTVPSDTQLVLTWSEENHFPTFPGLAGHSRDRSSSDHSQIGCCDNAVQLYQDNISHYEMTRDASSEPICLIDDCASPPRTTLFDEYKTNNHHNASFQPEIYLSPEEYAKTEQQKKRCKAHQRVKQSGRTRRAHIREYHASILPRVHKGSEPNQLRATSKHLCWRSKA
ncbi:hypothetical protein FH972_024275 [Carpinus fangiana]|uniref:Uncharacterized protein n=1 Tax=Carpinus fangiana TaxID=176857 RepID=A0A5N6L038_9ROSI|nr:hypothetical protein FH972_024275 [Carpinus fangiana]